MGEAKQAFGEIGSDAQSNLLAEMGILRQEIEALTAQVIPMVSYLLTKVQVFEESNIQVGTAGEERDKEIKDLRQDVNGLLEWRAGTAQRMDLGFGRTAERLAKLEQTNVDHQRQVSPTVDKLMDRSSTMKCSSRETQKSKRKKKDDESSDTSLLDSFSMDLDSEDGDSSGRSSNDEEDADSEKDFRCKSSSQRKSQIQGPMSVRFREPSRNHPGLKELRPTSPLYDKVLSYRLYRLSNKFHKRSSKETGKVRDFIRGTQNPLK